MRDATVRVSANRLLCDVQIVPDGCIVVVEDVGTQGPSGKYVQQDRVPVDAVTPTHALWIHTMSADECDTLDQRVRLQVLSGSDDEGLGELVHDGSLTIASGVLAVGDRFNPDRHLLFGQPTVTHVRVFVKDDAEDIRFTDTPARYPVSGPSDVTLLLPADSEFGNAVGNTAAHRPRWSWQRLR